jgi:hypothetical protein
MSKIPNGRRSMSTRRHTAQAKSGSLSKPNEVFTISTFNNHQRQQTKTKQFGFVSFTQ